MTDMSLFLAKTPVAPRTTIAHLQEDILGFHFRYLSPQKVPYSASSRLIVNLVGEMLFLLIPAKKHYSVSNSRRRAHFGEICSGDESPISSCRCAIVVRGATALIIESI
jgi:hypothetical protein